jgi:hypothetical protein
VSGINYDAALALKLQTRLAARGLYYGALDGIIGNVTLNGAIAALPEVMPDPRPIAWGARVSPAFRDRVRQFPTLLRSPLTTPDDYMAVMAFETGRTFSPSVRNAAGSGAVGLIQFMPTTLSGDFGLTVDQAAAMTAEDQLELALRYWSRYAGRLTNLGDVYMAVLLPSMIGKRDDAALFTEGTRAYLQNRGLDADRDGYVTRAEATARVANLRVEGLSVGNVG